MTDAPAAETTGPRPAADAEAPADPCVRAADAARAVVTLTSAIGTVAVGLLPQLIGLRQSLVLAAAVALVALPLIAILPETRHVSPGDAAAG
jgi:hypothetical protein